jgi:ribulose-phosphate 3-epimerase
MILIAPSLLSADFTRIADAVRTVESAGADLIHVDVMDGHFVPMLTFGPALVAALKKVTSLPLDVHLMVDNPTEMIPLFLDAGADWISVHFETAPHLHRDISEIRNAGRKAGVVLNPATPLAALDTILPEADYILLMTVNPGKGSQPFIEASHDRIRRLRRTIEERKLRALVEIDGGVSLKNFEGLCEDGAQVFVAGNAVFNHPDPTEAVRTMRAIAARRESR